MRISRLKLNQLIKWNLPFNFVSGPISHISLSALSIILLTMMPEVAKASTLTFVGGNMDGFDTTDGLEQSSPSNGSVINLIEGLTDLGVNCNATPQRCEIRNFDENTVNKNFLHTFNFANLAGTITSADLEIRVRGNGTSLNENDTISLYFVDSEGNRVPEGAPTGWSRFFGSGNTSDGLLNTPWGFGSDETFFFDLAALPVANPTLDPINLLPTLNSLGFLDIQVQDDTEVDYIKLTITTDSETIPEPTSTLSLLTLGTLGITSILKRKLKNPKIKS